jgi:hypothetical protein
VARDFLVVGWDSFGMDWPRLFGVGFAGFSLLLIIQPLGWWLLDINGEFDPGSGRTLAACLTHASRTVKPFGVDQWRTGE